MLSPEKISRYYIRGIKAVLYLIPFIPLYVSTSMVFPYITGKNFAFRILVEFAAALWVGLIAINKEYRLRNSPITLSILFFTFVVGLADLLGVNPYKSFWSNYERMEGYITILHLALYFMIVKSVMRTRKDWLIFFNLIAAAGFLVSIYALIMHPAMFRSPQFVIEYGQRVSGTIGNPPFLASYLLIAIFFTLLLMLSTKNKYIHLLYLLIIAINCSVIYLTASRGALIGMAIGLFLYLLFVILTQRSNPKIKSFRKAIFSAAFILFILSVIFLSIKDTEFIKHEGVLTRFKTILSDPSVQTRMNTWKMAWKGIEERPFLGWGQENFVGIYTVNPLPLADEQVWVDRAHNIIIDWLVNAGILGLFSYFAVFGAAFYVLWMAFQKRTISQNELMVIIAALTVYFIQNIFTFDTINSYLLFISLMAYIDNIDNMREAANLSKFAASNNIMLKFICVTIPVLLLFSIMFYHVNYKPLKESRFVQIVTSSKNDNSYVNILDDFNSTLSLNTFGDDDVRQSMSSMSSFIIGSNSFGQKGALEFVEKTVDELEKGISRNRFDLGYLTDVIYLYNKISLNEPSFIGHTESLIRACINLNPGYERLYFLLADTLARKRDHEGAIEIAGSIADQEPVSDIKYFELALIAILSSRDDVASSALEKMEAARMTEYDYSTADKKNLFSSGELRRLAQAYLDADRYYDAISVYQRLIEYIQDNGPGTARIHLMIANAYHILGNREKAVEEVKKAAALDPESFAGKADQFINSLNN